MSKKLWLPPEKPRKPKGYREHRTQTGLCEDQLAGFIKMLIDDGAQLQSLTVQCGFSLGGRYTAVYVHDEQLSVEIKT